jgi:glycosyltransferase involved in cell wall biosynthesis
VGLLLLEKIDVVMCTYNSNKPFFRNILLAIRKEIPLHCFIAVDKFSSDGTVDTILDVFPEAKVIKSHQNLGCARKLGIDKVDTRYFAFVDDDVLLLNGWYEHVMKLMKKEVGAVSCYAKARIPYLQELFEYTKPTKHIIVSSIKNIDSQRGFAYATLIKKEAISDWKPSNILSACEDHEILRHIVRKGFLWLTSYFVFAEHLGYPSNFMSLLKFIWQKTTWNTAGCRYTGFIKLNPAKLLFRMMLGFWAGLKISCLTRNSLIFSYYCLNELAFFIGYTCWKKKIIFKR